MFIDRPLDGETVIAGELVLFEGEASDAQDGSLEDAMEWSSNRQGMIGTGLSFQTDQLVVGTHVISLRAIDSDGMTGLDQIDLVVEPAPVELLFADGFESPGAR